MADLFGSLEIGTSRIGGAASRLRNLITNINEYMNSQRQTGFISSSTSMLSNDGLLHLPVTSVNNVNIDPSLQATAGFHQNPASFDYTGHVAAVAGIEGMGGDQFRFQIPPELLEGWPWPSGLSQGFGGF